MSKHKWGEQRSIYHSVSEWNGLPEYIRNLPSLNQLKSAVLTILK